MFTNLKHHLRYWGFLLLKFAAASVVSVATLWLLNLFFGSARKAVSPGDGYLLYIFLAGVWFQFSFGLLYLAIWDQRYRCRTCLRRLRMPVESGSWGGYMLQLGRPQLEYICPYGHGRLNVEELQITGKAAPEWKQQGDFWEELYAASDADSQRK